MDILLILFLVFFFVLLAIWLLPSWKVLAAQFSTLFPRASQGPADLSETRPTPPKSPDKHAHGGPADPAHKAKRHTVLPHQARGR